MRLFAMLLLLALTAVLTPHQAHALDERTDVHVGGTVRGFSANCHMLANPNPAYAKEILKWLEEGFFLETIRKFEVSPAFPEGTCYFEFVNKTAYPQDSSGPLPKQ